MITSSTSQSKPWLLGRSVHSQFLRLEPIGELDQAVGLFSAEVGPDICVPARQNPVLGIRLSNRPSLCGIAIARTFMCHE